MTVPAKNRPVSPPAAASIKGARHFTHEAMATVFELYVDEEDAVYAEQAARAAFAEVDRLEQELSRFVENSDISRLNAAPAGQAVELGLDAFECLRHARRICEQTRGAFDVTVGALYTCWLNPDKTLRQPSEEEWARARQQTGTRLLELDSRYFTGKLLTEGVKVDLGGIGKGYAADKIAELLREWKLPSALILAGASSVLALDPRVHGPGWPLTLSHPFPPHDTLARFTLSRRAVSGSGRQQGRHIIDPRPGRARPVQAQLASWALAPDAVTADALSTAFMVMSAEEIELFCQIHRETAAMIVCEQGANRSEAGRLQKFGSWPNGNLCVESAK